MTKATPPEDAKLAGKKDEAAEANNGHVRNAPPCKNPVTEVINKVPNDSKPRKVNDDKSVVEVPVDVKAPVKETEEK